MPCYSGLLRGRKGKIPALLRRKLVLLFTLASLPSFFFTYSKLRTPLLVFFYRAFSMAESGSSSSHEQGAKRTKIAKLKAHDNGVRKLSVTGLRVELIHDSS
jgi:hypothetical protein